MFIFYIYPTSSVFPTFSSVIQSSKRDMSDRKTLLCWQAAVYMPPILMTGTPGTAIRGMKAGRSGFGAPKLVEAPGWNLQQGWRMGAWNQFTLGDDDRLPVLWPEIERLGLDIAALSEVTLFHSGTALAGVYSYYWSSLTDVGLGELLCLSSIGWMSVSVRSLWLMKGSTSSVKLEHTCGFMSVVADYAPTE